MTLPDSYPVTNIKAELVQTPRSTAVPASRHLLEDSNSAHVPAQVLQKQDTARTSVPQPEPFTTAVWAISLQSSLDSDIPDAAAMQQRVTAEYAANDLVFQLAVVGYVGEFATSLRRVLKRLAGALQRDAIGCHLH
jgi:hypothetical protein